MKKYKFLQILKHFKDFMLCQRGDLIEEYIEFLFQDNATVNFKEIVKSDCLFGENDFNELPFDFNLSFKRIKQPRDVFLETVLQFELTNYVELNMESPKILMFILSKSLRRNYLRIFTFLIKFRYISSLIRHKWSPLNKDPTLRDNHYLSMKF